MSSALDPQSIAVTVTTTSGSPHQAPTAQAQQSLGLDDFHYFQKLPPELRLKIWRRTFTARVVEIDCCDREGWYCPIESLTNISSVLSTDQESRDEYLLNYWPFLQLRDSGRGKCAGNHYPNRFQERKTPDDHNTVYINATNEAVYLSGNSDDISPFRVVEMKDLAGIMSSYEITNIACHAMGLTEGYLFGLNQQVVADFLLSLPKITGVFGDIFDHDFADGHQHSRGEVELHETLTTQQGKERERLGTFWQLWCSSALPKDGSTKGPAHEFKGITRGDVLMEWLIYDYIYL